MVADVSPLRTTPADREIPKKKFGTPQLRHVVVDPAAQIRQDCQRQTSLTLRGMMRRWTDIIPAWPIF